MYVEIYMILSKYQSWASCPTVGARCPAYGHLAPWAIV